MGEPEEIGQVGVIGERRLVPTGQVQEKEIRWKKFKVDTSICQELQDKIAEVISKHIDASLVHPRIAYLEELLTTIAMYNWKLNLEKCVFEVEAGKFLGFLLTERGTKVNPEKCDAIIGMRSPVSVNEVQ